MFSTLRLFSIRPWRFTAFALIIAAPCASPLAVNADARDNSPVFFVRLLETNRDGFTQRGVDARRDWLFVRTARWVPDGAGMTSRKMRALAGLSATKQPKFRFSGGT